MFVLDSFPMRGFSRDSYYAVKKEDNGYDKDLKALVAARRRWLVDSYLQPGMTIKYQQTPAIKVFHVKMKK